MQLPPDTDSQETTIEFLKDTLFGVNTLSARCTVQVASSPLDSPPTLQLWVTPPWPAQLQDAHTLTFQWKDQALHGTVRFTQRQPDGVLLLKIEPGPAVRLDD